MYQEKVTDALHYAEWYHGSRAALLDGDRTVSYTEFADRCRRLAAVLAAHGVGHGDRVATLLSNRQENIELTFAVPGLGAALVPLNTRLAPPELRAILQDCTPRILITDDTAARTAAAMADVVPVVLDVADIDLAAHEPRALGEGVGESDPAAIFYTGGTTGVSKGVVLTHRNLVSIAHRLNWITGFRADDVVLYAIPMFHMAGWMWITPVTWVGGAHTVLPRFEAGPVLDAIQRYRVSFQCYMPTMLTMLLDHEDFARYDVSSLRVIVQGGASPALLDRCAKGFPGCSFRHNYGMTEASGHLTSLIDQQNLVEHPKYRSAGRPAPGIFVNARRPDGTPCEPGEVGELVASGANIMSGYWNKPELTAEVLRDGQYWTGDLGYIDEERNIYMVDRAKDMIKSGGENVYSAEVERVLSGHDAIKEVAVFGVPDDKWGERVHAAVVLQPSATVTLEDLIAHCREQIAGYKVPRSIEFHDELPKSHVGKILKRELRTPHWAGRETDTGTNVVTL